MKLSIIIPAYNEEDRIVQTLNETIAYLSEQDYTAEVLVISDGSKDNTRKVVQNFKSASKVHVDCLEYHPNRGKGYALRYGMCKGRGEIVMFMDADYSVPIEALEDGFGLLHSGYDIAIASRAVTGSVVKHHQNKAREFSARIYTFIQNRYLGIDYADTQCGFKLFTREAAHTLFNLQRLDSVIFDPEILYLAKRHNYKVGEFAVEWTHQEDSRIQYDSLRKSLFVFQELFRIRALHRQ